MARQRVTRIFDVLQSQGRSAAWFARQMGIDRTMLYRIDWGDRRLTAEFRARAALVLQVPEDLLFSVPPELRAPHESVSSHTMVAPT